MKKEGFDFYTIKQITEILQISRLTIYKFIETWKLKSYKFWKAHRIKKQDFEDFLEAHKQ